MCAAPGHGWLSGVDDLAGMVEGLAGAGWLLPVLFAIVAVDALLPVLPSGTAVMLAGMLSASGRVAVGAVLVVAAAGACCSDNVVYLLGRRWRRPPPQRWRPYAWMRRGLLTRPASVIIPGRFVPGVRFGVMLCAGAVGCPPVRFRWLSASAAFVWAGATTLSGYVGGATFQRQPLFALAMGLAVGAAVMMLVEFAGRRLRSTV
jgi:membrane protein DedA with SNARE-associated domain